MQILFWSILTVLEPNIDLFPLHFHEKNLPQNHANSYLIDFDCLEPNIDLVLLHFHEKKSSRKIMQIFIWSILTVWSLI